MYSKYLRDLGSTVSTEDSVIHLHGIEGIPDHTLMTVNREIYEKRLPDIERPINFASYGDPVFEQIIKEFQRFDLPDGVVRLTEKVPDLNMEVISYAAACINEYGKSEVKLITSYSELEGILLDENNILSEDDLSAARKKLHEMIRSEFDPTRSIERLVRDNEHAGRAHAVLNLLISDSLFPNFNTTEQDNFRQSVDNLDEIIKEHDQLMVSKIPTSALAKIHKNLLFNIGVPKIGEFTTPTLPIILVESAVDAACRLADSLKEKKSDLTIGKIKARIKRELKKLGFGA